MTRFVIITGLNHFFNLPGNDLIGPAYDAQHMNAFLLKNGWVATPGVYFLLLDATKQVEMAALNAVKAAGKAGDTLTHSRSGHGLLLSDGTPAMACSDIRVAGDDWDLSTLWTHTEIHDYIESLPAGMGYEGIFDTCHAGQMERWLSRFYAKSKYLVHPTRGGEPQPKALLEQPPNATLFAACGLGQTAADGGTSGGVFTTELLAAYVAGQSRADWMAATVKAVAAGGYEQVPELDCSPELAAKPFPLF